MHYFRQINELVDSKNFEFYVLVKGKQPCIYKYLNEIVDLTINYSNPHFRGSYKFHEAIEYARKEIRPNYYISRLIKSLDCAS